MKDEWPFTSQSPPALLLSDVTVTNVTLRCPLLVNAPRSNAARVWWELHDSKKKTKKKNSHNETLSVSSADRIGFSDVCLNRWLCHKVTLLSPSKNYLAITVICLLSMLQSKTSRPPVQQLRPDIPISAQHDSPCTAHTCMAVRERGIHTHKHPHSRTHTHC